TGLRPDADWYGPQNARPPDSGFLGRKLQEKGAFAVSDRNWYPDFVGAESVVAIGPLLADILAGAPFALRPKQCLSMSVALTVSYATGKCLGVIDKALFFGSV